MNKEQLSKSKKKLPDAPGVYFFLGAKKEILYIGKATSLANRVRSYFTDDILEKRSPLIEKMVIEAKTIEWTVTDSVLEALLLETNLIRTHKPRYNTISKDDKSFNHLVITKEEFPRVLIVRAKDLAEKFETTEIRSVFGPFTSGGLLKEALKIIRKIFQFYDTHTPIDKARSKMASGKINFNRQIGIYPDNTSKEDYQKTIRHIELLFEGKKNTILKELERDMKRYAKERKFEEAGVVKKKIFALTHIQDVALIKERDRVYRDDRTIRVEAYDVAHLSGTSMVGVMTVVESGEPDKASYRKFKIQTVIGANDTAALAEILNRRLGHTEWPLPQCIVVDGGVAQKKRAESVLNTAGVHIPVVAVVKDEHHRPKRILGPQSLVSSLESDIILANAEAHRFGIGYHRDLRKKSNFG
ncbi:GIY-YIG nuclease family protein [Patescibacteria group bacterium]|nr:GIY-YIG nuclease family protein [Patescibacteria group bacterium]